MHWVCFDQFINRPAIRASMGADRAGRWSGLLVFRSWSSTRCRRPRLDFIADVSRRRSTPHGSVCDVAEDGAVPRAGHFCAPCLPLGEGPASVGTGLVNGIERPVDVEERYFLRGGIHELALTPGADYAGCGDS